MMSGLGYSIFGFLVAIAILVAVHEYGHFWVARKMGVKVLKFSIGFGKSVYSWRRKGDPTEYSIGIVPLGGYVKMLDEREGNVSEEEKDQAFNRKSLGARSAIVAAGPAFNFLFAIFAIWLVFVAGSDDIEPVIGDVTTDSIAGKAGFRQGDEILSIDGREVKTWGQHQFYLMHQAMKENSVDVEVVDEVGQARTLSLDFGEIDQSGISRRPVSSLVGLFPPAPRAEVDRVAEDSPASEAGLMSGDQIVSIDGKAIGNWIDMVKEVSSRPGEQLVLSIRRDGQLMDISLTTKVITVDDKQYGQIGLYHPQLERVTLRYGPLEAIWAALDYNWRMTAITLRSLGRMLTAKMSSENLSGPITIARIAGDTAESGYADFLKFLAIISISLGLLNLLPIPVLDGGHLLYFGIEAVIGRPPSEKFMVWGQQIGIVLLIMLMVLAFYNDIMRLL